VHHDFFDSENVVDDNKDVSAADFDEKKKSNFTLIGLIQYQRGVLGRIG